VIFYPNFVFLAITFEPETLAFKHFW